MCCLVMTSSSRSEMRFKPFHLVLSTSTRTLEPTGPTCVGDNKRTVTGEPEENIARAQSASRRCAAADLALDPVLYLGARHALARQRPHVHEAHMLLVPEPHKAAVICDFADQALQLLALFRLGRFEKFCDRRVAALMLRDAARRRQRRQRRGRRQQCQRHGERTDDDQHF